MHLAILILCALFPAVLLSAQKVKTSSTRYARRFSRGFMLRAFLVTLFDPTFRGQIKVRRRKSKARRKEKDVGSFALGSGATFGPVCGPNGCH